VKRAHRRWLAFVKARLVRAYTTGKRAILTDADVTIERRDSEVAEAESFARAAESLRGGVAKLAQLRAYLDGSAPDARSRLAALWDRMPGDEPARIRRVIVEELGAEPEALFGRWEMAPLAAASLGQVHGAEDSAGARLAVKVQYPEVAAALHDDLASPALLREMVGGELGAGVDGEALERLRAQLLVELDYREEARSLSRFADAWNRDPQIVVPRPRVDRSAARVLTMERLDGSSLAQLARDGSDAERAQVARTILRFALGSPLLHGLFNADPHPGNYLVLGAAAGRVGFVDFGCVGTLTPELQAADRQLWRAMIIREGEELRHAAYLQGLVTDADVFENQTWREWEQALAAPFLARGDFELTPEHVRHLVAVTGQLLRGQRMSLPAGVLLLWRQRLGALTVVAQLRPRLAFRPLLAELLADSHPIPLLDRYR